MRKYLLGVAALILLMGNPASADEGTGVVPMLKMDTTYYFVLGSAPMTPAAELPGRFPGTFWGVAWEGTVQGDLNGVIRWWVEVPLSGVGRWEIWGCAVPEPDCYDPTRLIMAGYDAFGYMSDSFDAWAGKGVVTYVGPGYPEYAEWFGRRINDGGSIDYILIGDEPVPHYGEGWFTIYNKPSNKH